MENIKKNAFRYVIAIVVIGAIIAVLASSKSSNSSTPVSLSDSGSSPAPVAVTNDIEGVTQSTLNQIGIGTALSKPIPIKNAPAISENNKPQVFYEGAEYCPYCATERWALVVALSQFGKFKDLRVTHSSSTDVYPNTQTISFYNSTYTSNYISFDPVEIYTNIPEGAGYTSLQTPTSAQNAIVSQYDSSPYVPANEAGSIPFIDFGGKFLIAGATYSPEVLQKKSLTDISGSLNIPSSAIAKGADGAANTMIQAICTLTNNQPATVCTPTSSSGTTN